MKLSRLEQLSAAERWTNNHGNEQAKACGSTSGTRPRPPAHRLILPPESLCINTQSHNKKGRTPCFRLVIKSRLKSNEYVRLWMCTNRRSGNKGGWKDLVDIGSRGLPGNQPSRPEQRRRNNCCRYHSPSYPTPTVLTCGTGIEDLGS